MEKTTCMLLVLTLAFFCAQVSAQVFDDNSLLDSDLNGINSSLWQDLPLDSEEDKSPIVLIAKPFVEADANVHNSSEKVDQLASNRTSFGQTEDFFSRNEYLNPSEVGVATANASSSLESRFPSYKFVDFHKKFFSKFLSL